MQCLRLARRVRIWIHELSNLHSRRQRQRYLRFETFRTQLSHSRAPTGEHGGYRKWRFWE
jgi:hypothetical protein